MYFTIFTSGYEYLADLITIATNLQGCVAQIDDEYYAQVPACNERALRAELDDARIPYEVHDALS